jgi:hypothetical protein
MENRYFPSVYLAALTIPGFSSLRRPFEQPRYIYQFREVSLSVDVVQIELEQYPAVCARMGTYPGMGMLWI